jgi:hypothetical protein
VHAGCPANGRTNYLWEFNVRSWTWKEFPPTPRKPRGGASICISKYRIYRYAGFNGEREEGGQLDILELGLNMFNYNGGSVDLSMLVKGFWQTLSFTEGNMKFPSHRRVASCRRLRQGWKGGI